MLSLLVPSTMFFAPRFTLVWISDALCSRIDERLQVSSGWLGRSERTELTTTARYITKCMNPGRCAAPSEQHLLRSTALLSLLLSVVHALCNHDIVACHSARASWLFCIQIDGNNIKWKRAGDAWTKPPKQERRQKKNDGNFADKDVYVHDVAKWCHKIIYFQRGAGTRIGRRERSALLWILIR